MHMKDDALKVNGLTVPGKPGMVRDSQGFSNMGGLG